MGLDNSCPGEGTHCLHREGRGWSFVPACVAQSAIVFITASQYVPDT